MTKVGCSDFGSAPVSRRAAAVTIDAAVLVASSLLVVRRHLASASAIRRLAVPVTIQAAYFTITTAVAGGSPGQLLAGLRVVDAATGRQPSWRQAMSRWMVWAGPGVVARVAIAAFRNPSAKTKARMAILREEQDRLAEELSDDRDQLEERLPALHSGRRMAALWAPPAVTVMLVVVYKLTLGAVAPTIA